MKLGLKNWNKNDKNLYLSEKRWLFGTTNEVERNIWIAII